MIPVTRCKKCNKITYVDKYCDDCGWELELIIKEKEPDKKETSHEYPESEE